MKSTSKINNIRNRPKLRNFSERNILNFTRELENISWENVMTCKDTDECFDIFANKYDQTFNKCFPLTRMSIKRCNDKQWMTKSIRNKIIMKTRLYKKNFNRPNDNNKTVYGQNKNKLTVIVQKAEKLYYSNLHLHAKHSTREL